MSIGSGLASSFGFAPETTYGTYVAPTRWVESSSPQLKKVKNTVQGGAMGAGALMRRGSMRVVTSKAGGGTLALEVYSKRMGHLLNGLMGGTVTPVQQAATTAYLQTHAMTNTWGKSYTMQAGVPDLAGTVQPYTFLGSKVQSIEFACSIDQVLTASVTVDCRDVVEDQTLAAPSYPTDLHVFHFAQCAVKLGTYGAEASVTGVRGMRLRIERPQRTDRFYAGGAGLKAEPIDNDYARVSGTIDADYIDKATFADRFRDDTSTSLVWEFVGPNIDTGQPELFRITVPMIFFDTDTPVVGGPDIVTGPYNWVGSHDGTHAPATIEYKSADTTL